MIGGLKIRDARGQAAVVGLVMSVAISLAVGVVVLSQLFHAVPTPTDNNASTAYSNVQTLTWAGIGLLSVAIIVLAATTIMGIVRGGFGGRGGL
ncbi:MAG: hypothetical protein QW175_07375 [Candidatus Bathyarchaeia archaeon]